MSVTTTNLKGKGILCHGCGKRVDVVSLDEYQKPKCDECLPKRGLSEIVRVVDAGEDQGTVPNTA